MGEARRGINFSETIVLDRQNIYMRDEEYQWACSFLDIPFISDDSFADGLFVGLGAKILRYLDNSPYEGADLIHALNLPIPGSLEQKWSCIIDAGTLEHVFNFPEAIKNLMRLVKEGGHLLFITPWNGFAGHGFYQFSPEVFFRVLSEENGFAMEKMLLSHQGHWFSVEDPDRLQARVEATSCGPLELYLSARRIRVSPIFSRFPQQSDYQRTWLAGGSAANPSPGMLGQWKSRLIARSPFLAWLQNVWRRNKIARANKINRAPWAKRLPQKNGIPLSPS